MRIFIAVLFLFSFCSCSHLNTKQAPAPLPAAAVPKVTNSPVPEHNAGIIQNPWQLRQTQEDIPVYTRVIAGSPILEYKAHVIMDAPISRAIALFEDEKQIRHWYYQCVHSELVERDGPNKVVIYLVLHLPWPVAARDFVFRRTRSEEQASGIITYTLTALPDRLPPVKGMIRVRSIESIWRFKSLSNGRTELFFQQHTDPAGSVPSSIINQLAAQTPYNTLKNFRKLLTGKDA
jgi:START domain